MKDLCGNNMRRWIISMLIIVLAVAFTGCAKEDAGTSADEPGSMEDVSTEDGGMMDDASEYGTSLGEGDTHFTFTVTFEDATMNMYEISTSATTVGEALVELELIEGEDGDYGMYVTTVAGVTLDWETDAAYWGFYIDGEMAMSGVDTTEITEGSTYTLAYTQ